MGGDVDDDICLMFDCDRPVLVVKRGLCGKHYARWRKHGDPAVTSIEWDPEVRLARDLDKQEDGCWIFHGSDGNQWGHQRWQVNGKRHLVHRWMYERLVGPIPAGLVLDHLCRVPACCNPDHLEPVTQAENVRRGESLLGLNARKTHCKRGHAFDVSNTHVTPQGYRQCRTCRNAAARRYQQAARARANRIT